MSDEVRIMLNGSERVFTGTEKALTVSSMVLALDLRADRVALERNGEIVPRSEWAATPLLSGDRVELVHFVGGGA